MMQVNEDKKIKNIFRNKNVVIVGLARSGTGAANLLYRLGANVLITDKKPGSALQNNIKRLPPPVRIITDGTPGKVLNEADIIVVSPGVPLNIPQLEHAKSRGIPIISELELAFQAVASCELWDYSPHNTHLATPHFIGITGTNGKSTTTTLVDLMLRESGYQTLLGGNIGNALTEELNAFHGDKEKSIPDYIVAEISSFQLETISEFRPKIAAILNITPDHLDRYTGIGVYIAAKARIFENQMPGDFLILNADDPLTMQLYNERIKSDTASEYSMNHINIPEAFFFSSRKEVQGIYCSKGLIYCNLPHLSHFPICSADEVKVKGIHNLENAMAASLVSLISGCSYQAVRNVLKNFSGLEHRLEFVDEIKGVNFINDSKGTNTGAVARSLESFENVILIMGGIDKGSDYAVLRDLMRTKARLLILLGEAKEKIETALRGSTEIHKVKNMKEAVELSVQKASSGDTVLLSPGCASFDMFRDFEERGEKFREAVREVKQIGTHE